MAMPTFSEVSPLITCLARKKVFAVSTNICAMCYPKKFVIHLGSFFLIGVHMAASALPINLGLGTIQPINTPNKKYPMS